LLRRVPLVLARLILDALPIIAFAAAGHFAIETELGGNRLVRLTMLAVVDAYAICRAIFVLARLLLSPRSPHLRLVHVEDATAAYAMRWIERIVSVAIFGYAAAEVGLMLGMTQAAHSGLLKTVGLAVNVLLAIVVVQRRKPVAHWIAGDSTATGLFPGFRRHTSKIWHLIALFYLAALWLVWAVELRNGFEQILHVFLVTMIVGIGARLLLIVLLGSLDRALHVRPNVAERYPGIEQRARIYHRVLAAVLNALIGIVAALVLLQLWGLHTLTWFGASLLGRRLLSSLGTIVVTVALALAVWEATNAAVQHHLARLAKEAQTARSARLRTLLPLLKTTLFITIAVIVVLTVLSEIGLNIGPLLAGAGIVGVAIGFGSQKLVQDLINGIFLLLENAMQVGDFVTVSGLSGTVEALSVRTIRLRAGDGSVHIIPFSAVTSVTNTNRGLGNAAVAVTVAYDEDTDRVGEELKAIAVEMREEDEFKTSMLSDLQLWGVDKVDATSATLAGQIVCTDSGRWPVQREFNRRVKRRFQALGIRMPTPVQDLVIRRSPWDAALQQVRQVQPPRLQEDGQG
jgi:small-conductance mechanosensitive channel